MAESQPCGVRLVFRTEATTVELDVVATKRAYAGLPPRPDGVYPDALPVMATVDAELAVFNDGGFEENPARAPQADVQVGPAAVADARLAEAGSDPDLGI